MVEVYESFDALVPIDSLSFNFSGGFRWYN
jgi:hypothetical protein